MGIINRFLMFVYTLAIALLAIGVIAICAGFVPPVILENEIKFIISRWETIAGAVVVFIWSVHLLGCSISSSSSSAKSESEAIVLHGANGDVRVAVPAVSSLIEKAAMSVSGVEEAKAKIRATRANGANGTSETSDVAISLKVALGVDRNVAVVSDEIRSAVAHGINDVLGLEKFTLEIDVPQIAKIEEAKRPRVK